MKEEVSTPRDRKLDLVRAAGEVIRAKGLPGIRVREIARIARVSPGSVLYHYPEHDDLIFAVHQAAVDDYLSARQRLQSKFTDPRRQFVAAVEAGVPPYADHEVIRLLFELQSLASRDGRHADLMTALWLGEKRLYEDVLGAGLATGHFYLRRPVDDVAASLLATEDGLALHLVSNNDALTADRAIDLMLGLASTELGCPELSQFRDHDGHGPGQESSGDHLPA